MMQGMALYLVPLMAGDAQHGVPRMSACAYWIYLIGRTLFFGASSSHGRRRRLVLLRAARGARIRHRQARDFLERAGQLHRGDRDSWSRWTCPTVILKMRAPGMVAAAHADLLWATLVTSIMIMFAMPSVMLGANLVQLDRMLGTHFFNRRKAATRCCGSTCSGSSATPRCTSSSFPALGFMSSIIPRSRAARCSGTTRWSLSLVATGFMSFGLWVHHMFATTAEVGKAFFTAMSFMIAIPTAVQIFCWIATLATGPAITGTPLLFVLGFFVDLLIGG
jgi:cytochrome c oxidase subunit 1